MKADLDFRKLEIGNTQDTQEQMEGFIKTREHKGLADQRKNTLSKIDQKIKHITYCWQKSEYTLIVKTGDKQSLTCYSECFKDSRKEDKVICKEEGK